MSPELRLARYRRWCQQPTDWVVCPECSRRWQRNAQQRKDGTVRCSKPCATRAGNLARSMNAHAQAVARYRVLVHADPKLRLVLGQTAAVVALMLQARLEGLHAARRAKEQQL